MSSCLSPFQSNYFVLFHSSSRSWVRILFLYGNGRSHNLSRIGYETGSLIG